MKENLLDEYQRQAKQEDALPLDLLDEPLDEETARKLEEMTQKDNRERYLEIVSVHAAALNASTVNDRTYRSHDDTLNPDYGQENEENLVDVYGLGDNIKRSPRGDCVAPIDDNDDDYMGIKDNFDVDDRALSEADHYQTAVKRSNFLSLFLAEYNVDAFMATHLYGALNNQSLDMGKDELEDVLGTSMENMNISFVQKARKLER